MILYQVSVPIRGLFNLTGTRYNVAVVYNNKNCFRPHQGII